VGSCKHGSILSGFLKAERLTASVMWSRAARLFVSGKQTLWRFVITQVVQCCWPRYVECVEGETDAYTVLVGTLRKWPLAATTASGWPWSRIMSSAPRGGGWGAWREQKHDSTVGTINSACRWGVGHEIWSSIRNRQHMSRRSCTSPYRAGCNAVACHELHNVRSDVLLPGSLLPPAPTSYRDLTPGHILYTSLTFVTFPVQTVVSQCWGWKLT
jgi:hypothetical protein